MTFGSLFAGIGGFDAGFEDSGLMPTWQVEIDKQAQRVLRHHWPTVDLLEDVRECHSAEYINRLVRTWYNPLNGECYSPKEETMAGRLKKLTPEQAGEAVRLYEKGLSLAPIAGYFNVSRQGMWDLLRRRTTMRPQKREGSDNHFYRDGITADQRAHDMVEHAIRSRVMEQKTVCETCGSSGSFRDGRSAIQAHHDDYNKPLDVRWLCQPCHHEWHKHNTAKRKEVLRELAKVDIVCGGFP